QQFCDVACDFAEQPDSPNLYWALTALPRPLISLRQGLGFAYHTIEKKFLVLDNLDRKQSAEQWEADLQLLRRDLRRLGEGQELGKPSHPEWYPDNTAPGDRAEKSPELAEARKFVAQRKGISRDKVDSMPPAQVL